MLVRIADAKFPEGGSLHRRLQKLLTRVKKGAMKDTKDPFRRIMVSEDVRRVVETYDHLLRAVFMRYAQKVRSCTAVFAASTTAARMHSLSVAAVSRVTAPSHVLGGGVSMVAAAGPKLAHSDAAGQESERARVPATHEGLRCHQRELHHQ